MITNRSKYIDADDVLAPMSVAELLENIREDLGVSAAEMARKLGISRQQYSNIVHGNAPVSLTKAAAFSKIFEHPEKLFVSAAIADLLGRDELDYKVNLA